MAHKQQQQQQQSQSQRIHTARPQTHEYVWQIDKNQYVYTKLHVSLSLSVAPPHGWHWRRCSTTRPPFTYLCNIFSRFLLAKLKLLWLKNCMTSLIATIFRHNGSNLYFGDAMNRSIMADGRARYKSVSISSCQ